MGVPESRCQAGPIPWPLVVLSISRSKYFEQGCLGCSLDHYLSLRENCDPPPSPTVKQIFFLGGGWHEKHRRGWELELKGPRLPLGTPACTQLAGRPPSLPLPITATPTPTPALPTFRPWWGEVSLSKPWTWVIPESSIACVGLILQQALPLQTSESDMSPQGCLHTPHWAKPSL